MGRPSTRQLACAASLKKCCQAGPRAAENHAALCVRVCALFRHVHGGVAVYCSCGCERGSARKQSVRQEESWCEESQGTDSPLLAFSTTTSVTWVCRPRWCLCVQGQKVSCYTSSMRVACCCMHHRCKAGAVPPSLRRAPAAAATAVGQHVTADLMTAVRIAHPGCVRASILPLPSSPSSTPPQEQSHCGARGGRGAVLMPHPSVCVGGRAALCLYMRRPTHLRRGLGEWCGASGRAAHQPFAV